MKDSIQNFKMSGEIIDKFVKKIAEEQKNLVLHMAYYFSKQKAFF